jgi:hypothetical protein
LEQALIELDEQNTLNALEIKKREAKIFILERQIEEIEEAYRNGKENVNEENNNNQEGDHLIANELAFIKRHIQQH